MTTPAGLAWWAGDGRPGELWISDSVERKIVKFVPGQRDAEGVISIGREIKPGPVVLIGGPGPSLPGKPRLLAFDRTTNEVVLDLQEDLSPRGSGRTTPVYSDRGYPIDRAPRRSEIRGIAVQLDRASMSALPLVWTCRGGGLCSTIEVWRLDGQLRAELVADFFPRCEPIDIAIDPSGDRLWILADRGAGQRPMLIERRLSDHLGRRPWQVASGPSRRLVELDLPARAIAIAATPESVWVLTDSGTPSVRSESRSHLVEFWVGAIPAGPGAGGTP
jgi:hypothetical protein